MKNQTAVEFLIESVMSRGIYTKEMLEEFEQAKEMEKQQIIDAATWGTLSQSAECYYNDKYKSDETKI